MDSRSRAGLAAGAAIIVALSSWAGAVGLAQGRPPSAQRVASRFTDPPGQETVAVRRMIDQAKVALGSGTSTTDILSDPAFFPAHEWPRFRKLLRDSAQASPLTMVPAKEPGLRLVVTGRVVDRDGRPVQAAVMYFYQTGDNGWYSDRAGHVGGMEGDRKHARLFGYLRTDDAGRFELRTIRPAGYPDSELPAHIHVEVERANNPAGTLITEIRFDDDPRLTAEWRRRSQREGCVIAKATTVSENRQRVEIELIINRWPNRRLLLTRPEMSVPGCPDLADVGQASPSFS